MMKGVVATVAVVVLATLPLRARAQDPTEERLRALEEQLKQALQQLKAQQALTEQAQKQIEELRREVKQARAPRAAAAPGAAPVAAAPPGELEKKIEEKVRNEVARTEQETRQANAEMEKKIEAMKPAWDEYAQRYLKKFKVSTLFYGDYAFYQKTGFGPQFLTQINPPGPGNDNFNSFDITRTYINLFFTPTDDLTFRLTPNIFRSIGSSNRSLGKTGGLGSNLDGNLSFRLKYGYLDFNKPFARLKQYVPAVAPLEDDKVTFGQQPNPLIAWEEDLYGYRFTSLVPWNYTSLSSSQTGLSAHGPVKWGGLQYIDYDLGAYTNSSFHATEESETKQGMARVTAYPFGAHSRFDGLGVTGFYAYGYPNKTRDSGRQSHVSRIAALVHYTGEGWGVAGEYDQGHNAFSSNNLFSGSGPADQFGVGKTQFADFDTLTKALLDHTRCSGSLCSTQQGYAFFGHVDIPRTPFSLFGMYQQFLPNTDVSTNPLDFRRIVGGIGYRYNPYLRFALTSENLNYYHDQFAFPLREAKQFGATSLKSDVANAVPSDIRAVFLNVEFSY